MFNPIDPSLIPLQLLINNAKYKLLYYKVYFLIYSQYPVPLCAIFNFNFNWIGDAKNIFIDTITRKAWADTMYGYISIN